MAVTRTAQATPATKISGSYFRCPLNRHDDGKQCSTGTVAPHAGDHDTAAAISTGSAACSKSRSTSWRVHAAVPGVINFAVLVAIP